MSAHDNPDATSSKATHEMLLDIAEMIGPDASYIRKGQESSEGKLYLTGVEVALGIAVELFVAFLIGVGKGLSEESGKAVGEKLPGAFGSKIAGIRDRIFALLGKDTTNFKKEYPKIEKELSDAQSQLIKDPHFSRILIEKTTEQQVIEVRNELRRLGFVERKTIEHSKVVVERIQKNWPAGD
jgi:hypothetical protein